MYRNLKFKTMNIAISTQQVLKVLLVLSWIIFLGVCVEAGGILFNGIFALAINPANADYFWSGANLSDLYQKDIGYFSVIVFIMTIVAVIKAIMFYLILRILSDKKFDWTRPFNSSLIKFVSLMAYLSLFIGFFSNLGISYARWQVEQGIEMPDAEQLRIGGADVWFFMGVTLFVIAQIFKRGAQIQDEHELTV